MTSQSEQLEREAEDLRRRLRGTLAELDGRVNLGLIIDQLMGQLRRGPARQFFGNLARQVRDNPLPVVLIGFGIAWLAVATARSSRVPIAKTAICAKELPEIGAATSVPIPKFASI
jgi:hypothetical protein